MQWKTRFSSVTSSAQGRRIKEPRTFVRHWKDDKEAEQTRTQQSMPDATTYHETMKRFILSR
jgi:hypothetical protein